VIVHLIDGTYELFRHFYAVPPARDRQGVEIGAVRGVVNSIRGMLNRGEATHIGVATDHVIESFRNDLWPGYKTGAGIDPALLSQFPLLEEALQAYGVKVWPMVEYEADDALAAAAVYAAADARVTQVRVCSPDKDLAQCVSGTRVVQEDRLRRAIRRFLRRLSRPGRVGREVGGRGARQVQTHRPDSERLAHVGRQRARGGAVNHARKGSRTGDVVPRSRDASHEHRGVRIGRRTRVERSDAGVRAVQETL
jgi:hypothetical protein